MEKLTLGNRRFVLFDGICISQAYYGADGRNYGNMNAQIRLWGQEEGTLEVRLTEEEHRAILKVLENIPERLAEQITAQVEEE